MLELCHPSLCSLLHIFFLNHCIGIASSDENIWTVQESKTETKEKNDGEYARYTIQNSKWRENEMKWFKWEVRIFCAFPSENVHRFASTFHKLYFLLSFACNLLNLKMHCLHILSVSCSIFRLFWIVIAFWVFGQLAVQALDIKTRTTTVLCWSIIWSFAKTHKLSTLQ